MHSYTKNMLEYQHGIPSWSCALIQVSLASIQQTLTNTKSLCESYEFTRPTDKLPAWIGRYLPANKKHAVLYAKAFNSRSNVRIPLGRHTQTDGEAAEELHTFMRLQIALFSIIISFIGGAQVFFTMFLSYICEITFSHATDFYTHLFHSKFLW